ncbi:MAG: MFS transporter [Bacteroidota bacterium]
MSATATTSTNQSQGAPDMQLFWGCFIALVATSFGFIARVLTKGDWQSAFGLSETQAGEILGAGLWPFAVSIVLFSLIIDRVGYKVAMYFGMFCHIVSTLLIVTAQGYWGMYVGTLVLALGSGTVEAYINPLVATMFNKDKAKWLNILHAGWPGGLVGGGILTVMLTDLNWKVKIGLILIPTVVYAIMLWNKKFPIQERVAAGVSYKDMLKEVGAVGALIISSMVVMELGRIFFPEGLRTILDIALIAGLTGVYAWYTKSVGKPLFILLLLIMIPLATTELGIDSWIADLMQPSLGGNAAWVLIYTSAIMLVLRMFFAGPIIKRLTPLGLLAVSAALAALGLFYLSTAAGISILLAATLYGLGKTFFWPTTLGIVAEQFPRGGALTLNAVAGFGMIAVGIIGAPFLGYIQDTQLNDKLAVYDQTNNTEMQDKYISESTWVLGKYDGLNQAALGTASAEDAAIITTMQGEAKKSSLSTIAFLPIIMFIFYIALLLYFRSKGGYKPVELGSESESEKVQSGH